METVHVLPITVREHLANIAGAEQDAINAAVERARSPFQQARQAYLEGYCAGVGIDLSSQEHDWKLAADNSQLEPIEKPTPNRETRRGRKKAG